MLIIILPMPLFDITFWPEGEYPTLTDTGVHLLHEVARQCNATMALLPSSDCQAAFFRNMDTWVTYAKDSNVKVGVLNIFGQDYSSRYGAGGDRTPRSLLSTGHRPRLAWRAPPPALTV